MALSDKTVTRKRQKTFSLPQPLVEWVEKFYEENKEPLSRMGINNESQLVAALVKNGQQFVQEMIAFLKEQKAKKPTQ